MKIFLYFVLIKLLNSLDFNPLPFGNGNLNSNYSHKSTDNLFFVFEHFRHGARAPCNGGFLNNTDDIGGKWPDYGGLTNVGIRQHYSLGQRLRKYYDGFISREYDPKEIKIYCSNYNRTMISAQSQLLGFYNNMSFENIKKNDDIVGENNIDNKMQLNSIIPPINLFENLNKRKRTKFEITFSEKFECPIHKEMINKNKKVIDELEIFDKLNKIKGKINTKYFEILDREFKLGVYTMNFTGMYNFCDIYICNYFDEGNNRQRLNKVAKKYKEFDLNELLGMCYEYMPEKFFTLEGAGYANQSSIIIMSKIIKKMIKYMESRIINQNDFKSNDSPKFVMYSGHDDTLTQMQLFLNKTFHINLEWVPFASNQIFEIRKYGNVFYVEVYYNSKLKMNITFSQFSDIVESSIMNEDEINQKCYGFTRSRYFFRIVLLFLLFLFLFITYIITKIYYCFFSEKVKVSKPRTVLII